MPRDLPAYDRDEWRHWIDEDRDCQDTRQEVLIEEAVSSVEYTDSDRCRVESGEWNGPYTGETFTNPRDLDVDHMVPLANAHRSGGWAWSEDRKRQYANDLYYGGHLIAVQNSANRAKGADGPEEWRPPDEGYWCQYATDWIAIKNEWRLTATNTEAAALSDMLNTCSLPITLEVVSSEASQPTLVHKVSEATAPRPTTIFSATPVANWQQDPTPSSAFGSVQQPATKPTEFAIYDSCDEAEAAGAPYVPGSRGTGIGFPAPMVPSARDGDGDGVVCEGRPW